MIDNINYTNEYSRLLLEKWQPMWELGIERLEVIDEHIKIETSYMFQHYNTNVKMVESIRVEFPFKTEQERKKILYNTLPFLSY